MFEIEKTTNYRFQYNRLELRFKRFVDEAIEIIKEFPTDYQGKITHLANKKDGRMYRYRLPGCYLIYVLPETVQEEENGTLILTGVKMLYQRK